MKYLDLVHTSSKLLLNKIKLDIRKIYSDILFDKIRNFPIVAVCTLKSPTNSCSARLHIIITHVSYENVLLQIHAN